MVFMLIRFALQHSSLARLKVCRKHKLQPCSILNVDSLIKPFSFWRRIYLNSKLHNARELDEIIRHELVHIRQYHSVDIIVAAINRCIFWWNPFVWILNDDIRNNLEYIVDSEMLQNGINRKHYQYHLLNINQLTYTNNMVNYFNFSNFKKRIKMMNKEKTQPIYKIKWLLLPIVAAVILLSFNAKRAIATNVDFADYSEIVEPEPSVENDTLVNKIPAAPPTSKLKGKIVSIKVAAADTVSKMSKQTSCDTANVANSKTMNGVIIEIFPDNMTLITRPSPSKHLTIIDGKETDETELSKLKADAIHSFRIYKDAAAVKKYGEKGKNGVIVIETKGNEDVSESESEQNQEMETIPFAIVKPEPLIFIDGKESDETELSKLKRDDIESVGIFKEKSATELYGEKGKNGVIVIKKKKM
jgi:hypothetical protein